MVTASSATACTLQYAPDGGVDPCGATALALGLAVLGTGVGITLIATAAISMASAANMEMAAANPRILTQAVTELLAELDAQAVAGAQRQLQATASAMGLPVSAFTPWFAAEVPFTPTTESLVADMRAYQGIGVDYVRQLTLGTVGASSLTATQFAENLAVSQARGRKGCGWDAQ